MQETLINVVAAAIVDDLDHPTRLLAARRSAPEALAGRWEFPGGKVEPGEEQLDALHRELGEELGVRIAVGAELPGPDGGAWPITTKHRMRVWFARLQYGTPEPLEDHDELRWLTAAELDDVQWLEGDVQIVAALARHLVGSADGG
ncbi:8-oxo-dGTP diphosphatase [Promicromonospora sp. AC04]|uniref:(deoxy)nucleoside triphosphate pyrophosphohydrolase n=1 Tax=Promicromonospora sp. AC04 TaxID=2135723 RepID=UPI000D380A9A|nr:(deoxy)nucleoside triphosphate pyrophosphohydrolase [Promicromonospora sp. AC04]PUB28859.1 8-oxo-dGTP diphosphatase [Promicromonospora sp. AC04]